MCHGSKNFIQMDLIIRINLLNGWSFFGMNFFKNQVRQYLWEKLFLICIMNAKWPPASFWGSESQEKMHLTTCCFCLYRLSIVLFSCCWRNNWKYHRSTMLTPVKGSWESTLMLPLWRKSFLFFSKCKVHFVYLNSALYFLHFECGFIFLSHMLPLWSH